MLDQTKLKAFAADKFNIAQMLIFSFENIVGKGENAGDYQHFLLFPQCFLQGFFFRIIQTRDCVGKG